MVKERFIFEDDSEITKFRLFKEKVDFSVSIILIIVFFISLYLFISA